jgi:hypothetical protein
MEAVCVTEMAGFLRAASKNYLYSHSLAQNPLKTNYVACLLLCSERKLQATEYPHNLYIQNYSTATSTCLAVRKWLFSLSKELSLASDDQAMTFIFWQAVDDVNQGHIRADDRLYQLKALQDASRKNEVTVCRTQQLHFSKLNYCYKELVARMGKTMLPVLWSGKNMWKEAVLMS